MMLFAKASGCGEKKVHCLPQMMRANNKIDLDLDTPSLHPAQALCTLFLLVTQPCKITLTLLGLVQHGINMQQLSDSRPIGFTNKELCLAEASLCSPVLWVSPFPIYHEVLTLSKNVPMPLTLSENQLLKQRWKKKKRDSSVV